MICVDRSRFQQGLAQEIALQATAAAPAPGQLEVLAFAWALSYTVYGEVVLTFVSAQLESAGADSAGGGGDPQRNLLSSPGNSGSGTGPSPAGFVGSDGEPRLERASSGGR